LRADGALVQLEAGGARGTGGERTAARGPLAQRQLDAGFGQGRRMGIKYSRASGLDSATGGGVRWTIPGGDSGVAAGTLGVARDRNGECEKRRIGNQIMKRGL